MKRPILATAVAFMIAASMLMVHSQTPGRKVTILTRKGDVVEGVFKSLTDVEATIEIAGQPLKLPIDSISYLSFVGKVEAGILASASPIDAAFAALHDLDLATETSMLRPQYADKLQATMPPVKAFLKTPGPEWAGVKEALAIAVSRYESALSLDGWKYASTTIASASQIVKFAEELRARPNEEMHKENLDEQPIKLGDVVKGRLGVGDWTLRLRGDQFGAGYADRYSFTLTTKSPVEITMTAAHCNPRLALYDAKMDADNAIDIDDPTFRMRPAAIKKTLNPGVYHLFAACEPGQIGEYELMVK